MATKNCPVAGYEDFVIEYPDELLVEHQTQYANGVRQGFKEIGDGISVTEARFYGARALCSRLEGAPEKPVAKWPLAVFSWFMATVYYDHYDKAANPPKN